MKMITIAMVMFVLTAVDAQAGCDTSPCEWSVTCVGVVTTDADEGWFFSDPDAPIYFLKSHNERCNHPFDHPEFPAGLTERILQVCGYGDHCQITGTLAGRGFVRWTAIKSVKKLR